MKKYIYIACLGLLALTACESNLEKTPKNTVAIDDYFNTATDLQMFSNTFYNNLLDKEPYNSQDDLMPKQSLSVELLCGDARNVPNSGGGWAFTNIRKMNTLLEYAPKRCADQTAVEKYSAVARFFRAYNYFDLVKRFGDVPWLDKQLWSTSEELYAPRDSRETIMTHMIEDIDYAIEHLPEKSKESEAPYRVTKGAALALKANFCLFEGTFRKYHGLEITDAQINPDGHDWRYYLNQCVDACDKLMSGKYGSYKLYSTNKPNVDYRDLFTKDVADKDEYIFAVLYNVELNILHNANSLAILDTQGRPSITRKFVCSYLMKDGSRFTDKPGWQTMQFIDECKDRDPRMAQTMRTPGYKRIDGNEELAPDFAVSSTGYQPIKYVTAAWKGTHEVDRTNRSYVDMPVYRYAEVLLDYAEAKAELGELTQADLDKSVNLIRKRAGMPNMTVNNTVDPYLSSEEFGYPNVTGSNAGDILEIRRERTIELFQEHRRYYDLMRWKCGKCINQPMQGMYFPGPGQYDLSGDGVPDIVLYANGAGKPVAACTTLEIGRGMLLSDDTKGYTDMHRNAKRNPFNEERDYLYPVPSDEISLNPNLVQNPGWH